MNIEIIRFYNYIKKPHYKILQDQSCKYLSLTILFCLYLGVSLFLSFLIKLYCLLCNLQYSIQKPQITISLPLILLLIVIIAPIKEEVQFRLLLRPCKINFLIFIGVMIMTSMVFYFSGKVTFSFIYISFLFFIIIFSFLFKKERKLLYTTYFRLLFYLSILVFGLAHIVNYSGNSLYLIMGIFILTSPQILLGSILGYVRMMYGFKYSILLHILNNSLFFLLYLRNNFS